jgi:CBS domain-containing protein
MDSSVGDAARLLSKSGTGALLVVDGNDLEAAVVGLLTERDIFRALSARGPDVYGHCVWVITEHDFPSVDIAASPRDRMKAFCDKQVDYIALMDGFRVSGILSIWDCAGAGLNA